MASEHLPLDSCHLPPAFQLPHRYPFLLLDRLLMVEPGRWVVGLKAVTRNDPFVDAAGALPPVLLAEVMAQAAGLASAPATGVRPAVLARIDRYRCRPPIVVGDRLLVTARVVRRFGASVIVRAAVRINDRPRAAAELVLHSQDR